jgi:signal transduction histidine kinase
MSVSEKPQTLLSQRDDLAELLGPGVVSVEPDGKVRFADRRARELLGCAEASGFERLWEDLRPRLESAGLSWGAGGGDAQQAALDLPAARRLLFALRRDADGRGVLLVQDLGTLSGLATDLRLAAQMRSLAQISPAVAHDLRAPINAMVFNLEVLREVVVSGRAADPANQGKLLRYAEVLKEELSRLHQGLEIFLGYVSPRSDRHEALDLSELVRELAALLVAPARKQQVVVKAELPAAPVPAAGNRYLLRQALLHLALAALAGVPRQGTLQLRLARLDGRARFDVHGAAGAESPAAAAAPPMPDFALRFSPGGALAQLWVARSILAAHGGEVRASGTMAGSSGVNLPVYEVELPLGNSSTGPKE